MFRNGPEYEARLRKPFSPPSVTLKEIHAVVPKTLLQKSSSLGCYYVARDIVLATAFLGFASYIPAMTQSLSAAAAPASWLAVPVASLLWCTYWWFQGLLWSGIFCLELTRVRLQAGHGSLFNSPLANNTVGFLLHSALLIPYFAWRSTHHAHHKATGSMERDENYIPRLRSDMGLPPAKVARKADYAEIFEETPIWTLARVLIMQAFGWWLYLSQNTLGARMYPKGTNHFNPYSKLFKDHERIYIVLSDIGIGTMTIILAWIVRRYGWWTVFKYYGAPYLATNMWAVMFTYLHHSDPTIVHYYASEWTFLRGAAATVDRPLMGWMGRFFLHNISHDHVAHHFFVSAPFYNGPKITKRIRAVLGEHYNYDSTNTFYALWRSFTQCIFVEEEGGIVFYKNKYGEQARKLADGAFGRLRSETCTQALTRFARIIVGKPESGL
ncbi:delta-12 fatty acid desaturase protein [Vararia minispora EC-137]|uniref:Delta-12 fatty acid desaturase protein n=1 Tax=Vararia minispora EC-137 TaxID=1314806 RepID=A0ACB8Q794_9AGAM|nr:delta-12 fatty acid desaturase protein [Vararia minispora EC-137]